MEIFLGAFATEWQQRRAALLHDLSLGRPPVTDEEERRRRGGSVATPGIAGGRRAAGSPSALTYSKLGRGAAGHRQADRPMRARFAGLATGSQPTVVKMASFGGGSRLGAMINYVSRNGAVVVENERGDQLRGRDQLSTVGAEWDHLLKNRAESRDIGTFTAAVEGNGFDGKDLFERARTIVKDGLGERAFAIAVTARPDGTGFDIEGVTVLRSGQGERLTADAKANDIVQQRIDEGKESEGRTSFEFTGYGNGTDYGTSRLRALVEKHEGAVRDEQARAIADSKRAGDLVQLEWRDQLHSRKPRDVMHLILSARAGTEVLAFHDAARDFLGAQFASHRYVFSLHDASSDPKAEAAGGKRPHVHVHAIVAMRSDSGERIETTIRTFREWRLTMAESARRHGIDMEMTDRRDRASAAAYTRTQVRPVNTIGKTVHEGTSDFAQVRYEAKRRDDPGFATTKRSQSYERVARREWSEVSKFSALEVASRFAATQADRLNDRQLKVESGRPEPVEAVNSHSQFRTHLVNLSGIISESDDMRHMTRPEFEAYEKRVETALFQAERSMPENERKDFSEIADAAREHVNVRRELVELIEQRTADYRADARAVDEPNLDGHDRPQGAQGGSERLGVRGDDAANSARVENDRAREAVQAAEQSGAGPDRTEGAKREVELAVTKANEVGPSGAAVVREAAEIDDELRQALQAAERVRERSRTTTEQTVSGPSQSQRADQGGTPREGVETSSRSQQAPKEDRDERTEDAGRTLGDTTRGDPAKQHIPRLEELQREADERHQRDRDDRER